MSDNRSLIILAMKEQPVIEQLSIEINKNPKDEYNVSTTKTILW